jgi:hypothetical protein
MYRIAPLDPIDYLMIGHVTQDVVPSGLAIGGTAAYSSFTARALGLRVGIVTACDTCIGAQELDSIPVAGLRSEETTTFENIQSPNGRIQLLHHRAPDLNLSLVPENWRRTPIVHLGPVANEVDPGLVRAFPDSMICLTPQGWMRSWDKTGRVSFSDWPEAGFVLENSTAAVMSIEDVRGNESYVDEFSSHIRILAVTEGVNGARIYWNGDVRHFTPPKVTEVEPTGAGDVFAAAFFTRLYATRDPWEAGRFATQLAAYTVTRRGLASIPTAEEIQNSLIEIVEKP